MLCRATDWLQSVNYLLNLIKWLIVRVSPILVPPSDQPLDFFYTTSTNQVNASKYFFKLLHLRAAYQPLTKALPTLFHIHERLTIRRPIFVLLGFRHLLSQKYYSSGFVLRLDITFLQPKHHSLYFLGLGFICALFCLAW